MFSPKIQLRKNGVRYHICSLSNFAHFFTRSNVCNEQRQEEKEEDEERQHEVSVTNRSYWTRRIHKLCAVDHNVDEAIRLVNNLTVHGYHLDSLNLSSIIHALCDLQRFEDAHNRFLSSLFSSHGSSCSFVVPDERTCNVVIARLLDWGKRPYFTLHVVQRVMAVKPHFVPSLVNFNRLIDQFCSFSRVRFAHVLLFHMKSLGQFPNVVSYTTLINGYCRIGEISNAHKVFDEMITCAVSPNALTYSVLIRGVLNKRDGEANISSLLEKLWKSMADEDENDGHFVNNAAFSNVTDSLSEEGLFRELFNIAEDLHQVKNLNQAFAYAQLIDTLCRHRRHHGASRIVYIMRKRGFVPSLVSYNSIIHGLTKNGGYLRAYQLLEQGIEIGYTPSEHTYKIFIECLCLEEQDLFKAKKLLGIMLNKEGIDKVRISNIYLRALCKMKNDASTELLNTLVTMLETDCHPDIVTLNTVINGLCKMGKLADAITVLNDMINGKFNCSPDSVTFTTIISGLLNDGRINEALEILHKTMPEKGFQATVITYNIVLRGLFKHNLVNEAMEVFNSMVGELGKLGDTITHAIMIGGLCECNRVDEAKVLWDDVIWPSGIHDNFVYSAMIKGLCSSAKFNEGCDFVYELVDCGVRLNAVNYNILIEGACKMGLKKEAYQIVGEMRKNGIDPDAVTWRIIDKLHKQRERLPPEEKISM